jgi:hypothetical protein
MCTKKKLDPGKIKRHGLVSHLYFNLNGFLIINLIRAFYKELTYDVSKKKKT